jgi:hypothetical protein
MKPSDPNWNRRERLAAVALVCLLSPTAALAATTDHLRCDRITDSVEAGGAVDLATVPFGLDVGCTIEGSAREICSPVDASVLATDDAQTLRGDAATQERICYRIRCPERALPSAQVRDRFGTRTVTVKKPATVCVPVAR